MSNAITIEFSAEDRARIDKLTEAQDRLAKALEARIAQVDRSLAEYEADVEGSDEVRRKLAEVVAAAKTPAEPAENATGAAEVSAPPVTQPEAEKPTAEEKPAPWEPEKEEAPAVTLEQIQQKVIQLAAGYGGAKKAAVREIVNAYAKKVSDLPEDKWTEVWGKLVDLEMRA